MGYSFYNVREGVYNHRSITGRLMAAAVAVLFGVSLAATMAASAATTNVLVTPTDAQGWNEGATSVGGEVSVVETVLAEHGSGALRLATDDTDSAKAQYVKTDSFPLQGANVSYETYQVSASSAGGTATFQFAVDLDNNGTWDTNLVFEPYWQNANSPDPAPVSTEEWQEWNVDEGNFWSTQTVGGLVKAPGGPANYSLSDVLTNNPDAQVIGYGVNIGTYNRNYEILVDNIVINDTAYDFELTAPDVVAPVVTITSPEDDAVVQGEVEFRGTIVEDNLLRYYYVLRDESGAKVLDKTVTTDTVLDNDVFLTLDTTELDENATYTLRLEARDDAQNKDSGSVDTISFTVNNVPDNKEQCKNDGWVLFGTFKNQGQCVASVVSNERSAVRNRN